MGSLIKADFLKLSRSLGYKILILCSIGIGVLIGVMETSFSEGIVITGYVAFLGAMNDIQFPAVLISVFAAVFISVEFSDRTYGISLMGGHPRHKIFLSKIIVYLIGLIPIAFGESVAVGVVSTAVNGFGMDQSALLGAMQEMSGGMFGFDISIQTLVRTVLRFLLLSAAVGGFCVLVAALVKNGGGTIGLGIGGTMALSIFGSFERFEWIMKYSFMYQGARVLRPESLTMYIGVMAVTIVLTLTAAVFIFKRSELK